MSDKTHTTNVTTRGVIPFTGGLLFVVYAFFWPVEYGTWLVHWRPTRRDARDGD